MSKFLSLLISGIVSGAIYSMLAAGLTLTYSTTGIFNLGYGAMAFTCAFVYFELQNGLGWPNVWAAPRHPRLGPAARLGPWTGSSSGS